MAEDNIKQYETYFILNPTLDEDALTDAINKFKTLLQDQGAAITYEEDQGTKALAYPIQHHNSGNYYLIEFQGEPRVVDILEAAYRMHNHVLRFLTIALDKHAVRYYAEKRAQKNADTQA